MTVHLNNFVKLGTLEEESANPLIFTKLGYIRQRELVESPHWFEEETATVYAEESHYQGELVKRAVAIRSKQGVTTEMATGQVT